jgi:proteasome accessory factor C
MAAHEKMRRLLEMLLLLATGVRRSKEEISRHTVLSTRTVERYISTFRDAGFIIENHDGRYWIDKKSGNGRSLSDLLYFSEEEALILSKAIHAIDDNNVLKQNLAGKLYALYDAERVSKVIIHLQDSENVHALFTAIQNKRQVVLENYHSAHGNQISNRQVEPYSFTTNFQNIWCFEQETHENRLFKIARIGKVTILDNCWQHTNEHSEGFIDVFRMSSADRLKIKLRLSLRAASLLTEEYPLAEKYITENKDTYLFETHVCTYDGAGRFVLGLPGEVEVLETEEFKEYLQQRAKQQNW